MYTKSQTDRETGKLTDTLTSTQVNRMMKVHVSLRSELAI